MSRFIDADDAIETIAKHTRALGEHPKANIFNAEWVEDFLDSCPTVTPISIEKKTNYDWLVENDMLHQFLKDIVLTECADGVKFERVFTKKWGIEIEWGETVWNIFAKWLVSPHDEKDIFDVEEIHENCTVQILRNSATGEESIGWWKNEEEVD